MTTNIFLSGRKARTLRRGTQNIVENETEIQRRRMKKTRKDGSWKIIT